MMSSETQTKYRILSLDGGGIRGVISAKILEEIERQLNQPLNQYFDLIAGTSTGSILAAGLVINVPPSKLVEIYEKEGQTIFNSSWFQKHVSSWLDQPKYSNEGLIEVLKKYLGEIKFGDITQLNSKAKLLILAYDTLYRNTTFFASHQQTPRWFDDVKLWEICTSSASAPTFFPPYEFRWKNPEESEADEWKFPHVDGGVGANNPSLAALVHAMGTENKKLEEISILSIGTGRTTTPLGYEQVKRWGLIEWAKHIPDVFMGSQYQIAADLCGQMMTTTKVNNYLRLQFELNQRLGERKTAFSPRQILPESQRVNKFTQKKVNEDIDDGSPENLHQLIETTEAFLNSENYREVDGKSLSVKGAITQFIQDNS